MHSRFTQAQKLQKWFRASLFYVDSSAVIFMHFWPSCSAEVVVLLPTALNDHLKKVSNRHWHSQSKVYALRDPSHCGHTKEDVFLGCLASIILDWLNWLHTSLHQTRGFEENLRNRKYFCHLPRYSNILFLPYLGFQSSWILNQDEQKWFLIEKGQDWIYRRSKLSSLWHHPDVI